MKTNAIIRIILFSIAILVLTGILLTVLSVGMFMVDTDGNNLPIAGDGLTNSGAVGADEIQNIQIEWAAGPITILPDANTNQITITETAPENEKYHMVYRKNGNTLEIQFQEESVTFGINNTISKELCITVPANWICNSLEIDAASSSVLVSDMTIDDISFDSASGACRFDNCNVGDLDVNTASGNVEFTGTLNGLDCESASGKCYIAVDNVPDSICIEAASGDLELHLPENCGFSADIETLSGDFNTDYAIVKEDDRHVHGDGSCLIEVRALSGNVSIHKNHSVDISDTIPYCTENDCTEQSHGHSGSHH